jgi:hypothetical protein
MCILGTFDAHDEFKKYRNERREKMSISQIKKRPHQGLCICDNCGKQMQWNGIDWSLLNSVYLLCSLCTRRWFRENRYHKDSMFIE